MENYTCQARIAQLLADQLGTGEVPGSNPSKGNNIAQILPFIPGEAKIIFSLKTLKF